MPIEGKYGPWLADIIASGTTTSEINLRNNFSQVMVMVPTISNGTITVHISDSDQTTGTYYPLYELDSASAADFARLTTGQTNTKGVVFNIGAARYIKVIFGGSQSTLTVKVRGII